MAVLGGEDVLAGRGLRPVVPASEGAVKGRRGAPASGAIRPVGERVRELGRTPRTARPRELPRQGVLGTTRTPDTGRRAEQAATRPHTLRELEEEAHTRETRSSTEGRDRLS